MKKTTLFFGEVDTRHFTFHIFGKSEAEVRQLMMDAWERHSKDTGADPDHLQECDINILEFEVGKVYRDWREV